MVQSPRLRKTPGGAKCFWGAGEGGRSLTTVGVCVQQQDRAAGGRVPVPAGLTRTRLPLVSRRAAPRPPAARADVVIVPTWLSGDGTGFVHRLRKDGVGSSPTVGSVTVAQEESTRP